MSSSPVQTPAARKAAYEAAVREKMMALEPSGRFPEIVESAAMIARRAT